MTTLTTEERLQRLEDALVQLAYDTSGASMNHKATRRGPVADLIAERDAEVLP